MSYSLVKLRMSLALLLVIGCSDGKSDRSNLDSPEQQQGHAAFEQSEGGMFALPPGSLRTTVRGIRKGTGSCVCSPAPCRWTGIVRPASGVVTDDRPVIIPNSPYPLEAAGSQKKTVTMLSPSSIASTTCRPGDTDPLLARTTVTGAISINMSGSMSFRGGCFGSGSATMCFAYGSGTTWSTSLQKAGATISKPCGNFSATIPVNSTIDAANNIIDTAAKNVYNTCYAGIATQHLGPWTVVKKRIGPPPTGFGDGLPALPSFMPGGSYLQQTNVILGR